MGVLLISAASVAFFHAIAPDHWLPFVALARASRWPMRKLAWVTTWAGIGHVVSSLLLGGIGLAAGMALNRLQGTEAWRGNVGLWLLIGFGVAYALWGFKHAQHHHPHVTVDEAVRAYAVQRMWMLMAILVFGPCEPLIPLMFVAAHHGTRVIVMMSAVFSVVTVGMIISQSCLAYAGVRLIAVPWMERYAHALAGLMIVLTALFVMVAGL